MLLVMNDFSDFFDVDSLTIINKESLPLGKKNDLTKDKISASHQYEINIFEFFFGL